jgi:hypothetical protein
MHAREPVKIFNKSLLQLLHYFSLILLSFLVIDIIQKKTCFNLQFSMHFYYIVEPTQTAPNRTEYK